MAKGVRLQPIVSHKAAEKIKLVAEENGETVSTIINRLILMQLANPQSAMEPKPKTATFKQRLGLLEQRGKTFADRMYDSNFTYADQDEWYKVIEQIAKLKHENDAGDPVEQVMQRNYHRELDQLMQQHEADAEDLFNPLATPEFHRIYKERVERINVLKDRLK
jgi:hypothetical protein